MTRWGRGKTGGRREGYPDPRSSVGRFQYPGSLVEGPGLVPSPPRTDSSLSVRDVSYTASSTGPHLTTSDGPGKASKGPLRFIGGSTDVVQPNGWTRQGGVSDKL